MTTGTLALVVWTVGLVGGFVAAGRAAAVDWVERRLPNPLVAQAAMWMWATWALVVALDARPWSVPSLAWAVSVLVVPMAVVWLVAPSSFGPGDLKLSAALVPVAAWPTAERAVLALLVMFVAATPHAIAVRRSDRGVPFGPYIVIGYVVVAAVALAGQVG